MAKWAHANVLDSGPEYIRGLAATASRVVEHLVKAYAVGDSYATVVANSVANAEMIQANFVLSSVGSNRKMAIAAKNSLTASASSGTSPDLHLALVDSVGSAVLLVTDETANQVVTIAETVNLPAWSYTVSQPV